MFWLAPRTVMAVLLIALGALLGQWLGSMWGWALLGTGLGASLGGTVVALFDGLRGGRLLSWLSGPMEQPPPHLVGFWGEAGTRVERGLRQREREILVERERRVQFLQAIEASPNGVLLLDRSEHIEWCTAVAAEHLGLDPGRDLQQRITNLVRAPAFVAHLQARNYDLPVQIPGPKGRGLLSVIVRPYGDGNRLLLTQDITERERVDATRRDFVANVSHEIRTPLTVLAGFVETLATLQLSEAEQKRVLALMGQQARRMQNLVGDLLTLAGLEGGPRPPLDTWVPLTPIGHVVETDARALSNRRHALAFDWGRDVALAGSETELASAIANLVNNAVRYTPVGGQIRVLWQIRQDGSGELAVHDTGPGIAAEHLPRLAERFYRVDGSRSRDTGGTGLGLSIVKHVAQRHGGELLIRSEVGHGSSFILLFPASRIKVASPSAQPLPHSQRLPQG